MSSPLYVHHSPIGQVKVLANSARVPASEPSCDVPTLLEQHT